MTLVASRDAGVYRRFSVPGPTEVIGELRVNPLYAVERRDGRYRNLFARSRPHMFGDTRLFDALVEDQVVDLSTGQTAEQLGTEPSLTLVASRDAGVYRRFSVPGPTEVIGELRVNPLYAVERRDGRSTLRLTFPTPEYEAEFRACRRYLPDTLVVDADLTGRIEPALVGSRYDDLRRRHVLIDLPAHYW